MGSHLATVVTCVRVANFWHPQLSKERERKIFGRCPPRLKISRHSLNAKNKTGFGKPGKPTTSKFRSLSAVTFALRSQSEHNERVRRRFVRLSLCTFGTPNSS